MAVVLHMEYFTEHDNQLPSSTLCEDMLCLPMCLATLLLGNKYRIILSISAYVAIYK